MIQFNPLQIGAHKYKTELIQTLTTVITSGKYLEGPQNALLIEKNKDIFKKKYIQMVSSGHDALYISLKSLDLQPWDEVIFPVNAYPTAFPLALAGIQLVPADTDLNGQLDPFSFQQKITKKTKVVVVVHLYGLVGNLNEIIRIAKKNNIKIIEDCAQSYGVIYKNKYVGTFGDAGCYSFYPTKLLPTFGDGGMIVTNNKKMNSYIVDAKSYGERERYDSQFVSAHSRLPEMQAGVLNVYINHLDELNNKRLIAADLYSQKLESASLNDYVRVLQSDKHSQPIHHLFVIEAKRRDKLQQFLLKKQIPTLVHYPTPIHLIPSFKYLNYKKKDFPKAEHISNSILSLPFHPYIKTADIEYIVESINKFYS